MIGPAADEQRSPPAEGAGAGDDGRARGGLGILLGLVVALSAVIAVAAVPATTGASAGQPTTGPSAAPVQADAGDVLSVRIQTPRNVLTNVTLNYSVETSGADGNVTAVWDFEGETKRGTTVQHEFVTEGNATIEVTVTDESGESVTKSVTVDVVDLEDETDEDPLRAIFIVGMLIFFLVVMPLLLKAYILPKAMVLFEDAL